MKIKMGGKPIKLKASGGSTVVIENLESVSNLYVNGENAEQIIIDYIDEHPELIPVATVVGTTLVIGREV